MGGEEEARATRGPVALGAPTQAPRAQAAPRSRRSPATPTRGPTGVRAALSCPGALSEGQDIRAHGGNDTKALGTEQVTLSAAGFRPAVPQTALPRHQLRLGTRDSASDVTGTQLDRGHTGSRTPRRRRARRGPAAAAPQATLLKAPEALVSGAQKGTSPRRRLNAVCIHRDGGARHHRRGESPQTLDRKAAETGVSKGFTRELHKSL